QADLLPLDGVPPRALVGEQHHQPPARSARQASRQGKAPRLARAARSGTGRRTGQWGAWATGGGLPRLDGYLAAPCDGVRVALRIRHLSPDDPGWLAARAAGQLAAPARPVGGGTAARSRRGEAELLVRAARRGSAHRARSAVEPDRHPVRPTRGGV